MPRLESRQREQDAANAPDGPTIHELAKMAALRLRSQEEDDPGPYRGTASDSPRSPTSASVNPRSPASRVRRGKSWTILPPRVQDGVECIVEAYGVSHCDPMTSRYDCEPTQERFEDMLALLLNCERRGRPWLRALSRAGDCIDKYSQVPFEMAFKSRGLLSAVSCADNG